jgi:uncharacterized small protein (DUF1192 family)
MEWDDVRPKPVKGLTVGENLETLSVAELEARISALEAEIKRVALERDKKRAHEVAARDFFKR